MQELNMFKLRNSTQLMQYLCEYKFSRFCGPNIKQRRKFHFEKLRKGIDKVRKVWWRGKNKAEQTLMVINYGIKLHEAYRTRIVSQLWSVAKKSALVQCSDIDRMKKKVRRTIGRGEKANTCVCSTQNQKSDGEVKEDGEEKKYIL